MDILSQKMDRILLSIGYMVFFAARLILHLGLFAQSSVEMLGIMQLMGGWPATVV